MCEALGSTSSIAKKKKKKTCSPLAKHGGAHVSSLRQVDCEFEANLGHIVRPCLKEWMSEWMNEWINK
jgi:hypothetical protein